MIIVMLCIVLIKIQMFALKKTPQIYGLTQAVARTYVVAYYFFQRITFSSQVLALEFFSTDLFKYISNTCQKIASFPKKIT